MPRRRQTFSAPCGQSLWDRHGTPECEAQFKVVEPPDALLPRPYSTLRCLTCAHVLHIVRETRRPLLLLWSIEQGEDETFREFVDRGYAGRCGHRGVYTF
jgi:hypothetical protein